MNSATSPPPQKADRFDVAARIDGDAGCRRCGYNLRGLAFDAACPECAHSVAASLANAELRFADPQWLRRVAVGGVMVLFGELLNTAAIYLPRLDVFAAQLHLMGPIALGLQIIAGFVLVSGAWLSVTHEPNVFEPRAMRRRRQFVRAAFLASTTAHLVALHWFGRPKFGGPTWYIGLLISAALIGLCAEFVRLRLLRQMVARAAARWTCRWITLSRVLLIFTISIAILHALVLLDVVPTGWRPPRWVHRIYLLTDLLLNGLELLGSLVWVVAQLAILLVLRRQIRLAAEARNTPLQTSAVPAADGR